MPPIATTPNQRSHRRSSFSQIRTTSITTKMPSTPAITRCECSKNAPPASILSDGNHVPNDFGQSGTDSAASLEVTSAPATKRRTVQATTNFAKRCTPGLYVDVMTLGSYAANYTPASIPMLTRLEMAMIYKALSCSRRRLQHGRSDLNPHGIQNQLFQCADEQRRVPHGWHHPEPLDADSLRLITRLDIDLMQRLDMLGNKRDWYDQHLLYAFMA